MNLINNSELIFCFPTHDMLKPFDRIPLITLTDPFMIALDRLASHPLLLHE